MFGVGDWPFLWTEDAVGVWHQKQPGHHFYPSQGTAPTLFFCVVETLSVPCLCFYGSALHSGLASILEISPEAETGQG